MKKLLLFLTASLLCLHVGAQSLQEIQAKAESGDVYSQYLMGWSLVNSPAKADYSAAKPWFEKAKAQGMPEASGLAWAVESAQQSKH